MTPKKKGFEKNVSITKTTLKNHTVDIKEEKIHYFF